MAHLTVAEVEYLWMNILHECLMGEWMSQLLLNKNGLYFKLETIKALDKQFTNIY